MLVVQTILTILAVQAGRLGTIGVVGLALIGAAATLGQHGEHIVLQMLNPTTFDLAPALLVIANIALSLGMLVFGILEWRTRRQRH